MTVDMTKWQDMARANAHTYALPEAAVWQERYA